MGEGKGVVREDSNYLYVMVPDPTSSTPVGSAGNQFHFSDSRNFGSPASRDTSPSSETNSRPSSPTYSPSPPSWRPDEAENKAVVNPGYDALLYRRLYNTPPPPLPPKSGRRRRNSDSAVSDCSPPSPDTPLSPAESYLAGQLAQHTARPR